MYSKVKADCCCAVLPCHVLHHPPVITTSNSMLVKWRLDLKKETENIICWTGKERKIIWLVCVPAVHGLRTSMSPQFSTTTYCVVLLNQHGNPPQHCHVPCHGGSMEGSRAAQTLTLSSIDRGVLRFFSGVQQQQHTYSYTHTPMHPWHLSFSGAGKLTASELARRR